MPRTVIIGAGLAGQSVARELRALSPDHDVTLVTQCAGHLYPKPQLSTGLRTGKQPGQLITKTAEEIAASGIELLPYSRVSAIDLAAATVTLSDGRVLAYDDLVLAVGASPFVPPMAGNAEAVFTVNHLDDYRAFRAALKPGARVLLVGGGLIGVEFASDLLSQGHGVDVVDPGPGPLPRLLPEGAASLLIHALAEAGARFHWGTTVARLDGEPGSFQVTLSDGTLLEADLVLSAVGLRPQTELARAAGLPVGRGILVDGFLRAAPHVYALGDCAELPGGVYLPFIKPIGEQAKFVGAAIAGEAKGPYTPANYAVAVKVQQWPVMSTTPLPDEAGTWEEVVSEAGSLSKLLAPDGRVLRVVATGDRAAEVREWLTQVPPLAPAVV